MTRKYAPMLTWTLQVLMLVNETGKYFSSVRRHGGLVIVYLSEGYCHYKGDGNSNMKDSCTERSSSFFVNFLVVPAQQRSVMSKFLVLLRRS